jgi:hypothetical protein
LAMVLTSFVVATLPMLRLMLLLALLLMLLLLLLLPPPLLLLFKSIASVILLRRFRHVPIIAACREICRKMPRKMPSFFQLLPTMREAAKRTNPTARVSAGDDG